MRAVGFVVPTPTLSEASFASFDLPIPQAGPDDLLIEVKATSINPVDYKQRQSRAAEDSQPVILGWDAAGTVRGVGSNVTGFAEGDAVYYAGELNRSGSNAEFQLVDYRLVSAMPKSLSFASAAALPLTSLTAYEALFEQLQIPATGAGKVLIIGGAGGVGSMAIQLLRALTDAEIYATAGRLESSAWAKSMGAHHIVDRGTNLVEQRAANTVPEFDYIFSTTNSEGYQAEFPALLKPYGRLCLIDDPKQFDIVPFKLKSQSIHWELMFTKGLFKHGRESQGAILRNVAQLTDDGRIKSTLSHQLYGLEPQNLMLAHRSQESGATVGKTVISYGSELTEKSDKHQEEGAKGGAHTLTDPDSAKRLPKGRLFNQQFYGDFFEVFFDDAQLIRAARTVIERGDSNERFATQSAIVNRAYQLDNPEHPYALIADPQR